jgi:nucleotide-binding universal stress UspA family protein
MKILHPTDFSESAAVAEAKAVELAKKLDAEVILLHVAAELMLYSEGFPVGGPNVESVYASQRKWVADQLAGKVAAIAAAGIPARFIIDEGVAYREIVKRAEAEGVDFIIMGTQGRTGLDRWLLGSVAERVVRSAACPVITVRPPATATGVPRTASRTGTAAA